MFFGGGQNKDRIGRRFFQSLQECIERSIGKHVNFIDDIHFEFAELWRIAYLIYEVSDIFNGIVGSCIQFKNIKGICFGLFFKAIDKSCNNTCAQVVLPTPRGPQKRSACASLLLSMAFLNVVVICSWPTTSSNPVGRYFRADTTKFSIRRKIEFEVKV